MTNKTLSKLYKEVEKTMKGQVYGKGATIGIYDDGFQEAVRQILSLIKKHMEK